MEKFGPWNTYCAMVDVLETRSPTGDDIPEKAQYFLSEANPRIWQGEVSGDPAIYSEFREAFEKAFPEGAAEPYESADVVEDFLASMQELYKFVDDISDDPDVDFWKVFDEVTEELSWPHFFGIEPAIGKVNQKALQEGEVGLLRSLIGGTMGKFQRLYELGSVNRSWEYVGLEVGGSLYELAATNVCVSYYKSLEDFCPLRFRKLGGGQAAGPDGTDWHMIDGPVGKEIADVLICTETEMVSCDGRPRTCVSTRAIAFAFVDGEQLAFDRSWYFQEPIDILRGPDATSRVKPDEDEAEYEEEGHLYSETHSIEWRSLAAES